MQLINSSSIKKTFAHTWYLYPIAIAITAILWLWGFQAFHQPSAHQSLTIFFASEVKDSTFTTHILNQYEKEDLREIKISYSLREGAGFTTKLQLAINTGDLLVLDEKTLSEFNGHQSDFFTEITSEVKNQYYPNSYTYYSDDGKDYGIFLKGKGENHYLNSYMNFDENEDYYIVLLVGSQNLGKITSLENEHYDNALTVVNRLITE